MDKDEIFEKEATYVSPITVELRQIQRKLDNFILNEIRKYDVKVDKEELIKALKYDRNQYEKGYADGKMEGVSEILRTIETYGKHYKSTDYMIAIIKHRYGIE